MKSYQVLIRESHLDSFGHVNNATYLTLFEEARWDIVAEKGFGLYDIMKNKKGPVILEVNLKYLKEILLREIITITTEVVEYKSKIGKLKQLMIKPDGSVAAEAIFTVGLFDLKERKLIDPTPEWLNAIS